MVDVGFLGSHLDDDVSFLWEETPELPELVWTRTAAPLGCND